MTEPRTLPWFGRYQPQGLLGEGGFAEVFAAWDPVLRRPAAVKALLPRLARSPAVRERFLAETRAVAALSHRNIVAFYDVGEENGRPYYAMELIDGPTLSQWLGQQGPCSPAQVAAWLAPLASAVDYLHAAGFVHRDIKAANVMLDRSGRIVLMDLGIARAIDSSGQTLTGALVGSEESMAPEQVLHETAGPAADIYGLGVLAYRLLTGRPPFTGSSGHVLYAHASLPPPPLRGFRPDLPAAVEQAVLHALAKEPADRPQSAAAFAAEVAAALQPSTAPPAPSAPEPPAADPSVPHPPPPNPEDSGSESAGRAGTRLLIGGALALILLLAGALSALVLLAGRGGGDAAAGAGGGPLPTRVSLPEQTLHGVWQRCAAAGIAEEGYVSEVLRLNPALDGRRDAVIPPGTSLRLPAATSRQECNGAAPGGTAAATTAAGSATRTASPTPPPPPGNGQYLVVAGDTLEDIHGKCAAPGVDREPYFEAILQANPVLESNPANLKVGQTLQLPVALTRTGPICNGGATPIPTPSPPPTAALVTPTAPARTSAATQPPQSSPSARPQNPGTSPLGTQPPATAAATATAPAIDPGQGTGPVRRSSPPAAAPLATVVATQPATATAAPTPAATATPPPRSTPTPAPAATEIPNVPPPAPPASIQPVFPLPVVTPDAAIGPAGAARR